jgi:hypothetical protein
MENVGIFISIWNILVSFGIIYGRLIYCVVILHIFPVLVCLDQEKSGNPVKVALNSLTSRSFYKSGFPDGIFSNQKLQFG